MFVSEHRPKMLLFRHLPVACKFAVIWWLAIDEDGWEPSPEMEKALDDGTDVDEHIVRKSLRFYDSKYGNQRIGFATVPMRCVRDVIRGVVGSSFDAYHRRFCKHNHVKPHPKRGRWPLVINPETGAIIDGYHRFHDYVNQGARAVRCVWTQPRK